MTKTIPTTPHQNEPSPADWQRLYAAADAFYRLAPWEWVDDDCVFGVRCLETKEVYYCIVLGALGEVFALIAYEGAEGLEGYYKCLSGEIEEGPLAPEHQRALMASFEDRADLDPHDRAILASLGRKYRGAKAWPLFRHILPGYFPWFLSDIQARTLAVCLEQAVEVLPRVARDPGLLPDPTSGLFLMRLPRAMAGGQVEWQDETVPAPPKPRKARPQVPVDEVGIQRLLRQPKQRTGDWEIGYAYTPISVQQDTGQRPYLLRLLLITDAESGLVLTVHLEVPGPHLIAFRDKLLACLGEAPRWPRRLLVNHDDMAALAAPIAKALGISMKKVRRLPAFEMAYEGLLEHMKR